MRGVVMSDVAREEFGEYLWMDAVQAAQDFHFAVTKEERDEAFGYFTTLCNNREGKKELTPSQVSELLLEVYTEC